MDAGGISDLFICPGDRDYYACFGQTTGEGVGVNHGAASLNRSMVCFMLVLAAFGVSADINDPFERVNRSTQGFNDFADRHFMRPIADGYARVLPGPVYRSLGRVYSNFEDVGDAVNNLLQGKPGAFISDLLRVSINSTIGLGGFFDPASRLGLPDHDEDFAQTLAYLRLDIFEQLGPFGNSFVDPTDVALGFNGNLFVVDSAAHKVKSFETPFYDESKIIQTAEVFAPEVSEDYESDDIDPSIMAPSDIKLEATDLFTTVSIGDAIADDSQSGIKAILNNAPEKFSLGVSKVTWIAFDNAGNTAEDYQNITVYACGNVHSNYNMIVGTDESDVLQGTSGDDIIFGLEGNDIITGLEGNDCIFGGEGDDVIYGNGGYDTLNGNSGHDILKGDSGFDVIYGGSGSDVLDGGSENDNCYDSLENVILNCNE